MAAILQSSKASTASGTSVTLNVGNSFGNGSVDTTPGSLLVASVVSQTAGRTMAASDNVNGAYNTDSGGTGVSTSICTFPNAAGGAITITGTMTGGATFMSLMFEEWNGVFTVSPLDAHPASVSTSNTTSVTSNSTGTLAQANELILTNCRVSASVTNYLVQSPFTEEAVAPAASYHNLGWLIVSSTAAQTATFNWTTTASNTICIASYKLLSATPSLPYVARKYFLYYT